MIKLYVLVFISILAISCSTASEATNTSTAASPSPEPAQAATFADARQALDEGNRLLELNETESAIAAFDQAIAMDPELAEAYFGSGIAHSLLEKAQIGSLTAGEDVRPSNRKGGAPKPTSVKMFEKAVELYKKHLVTNPEDDVAFFNQGRALNKLNEDEDAEKALERAVKLKPDDSEYLTELGAIRVKLAKYRDAIEPLEKALEIDPENSEAQNLLEDAQAGRKRIEFTPPKKDGDKIEERANSTATNRRPANTAANKDSTEKPDPVRSRPSPSPAASRPSRLPQ